MTQNYGDRGVTMASRNKKHDRRLEAFLRRQMMGYIGQAGVMSKNEMNWLRGWVAAGNSVFDNPFRLRDGRGHPMGFIDALRFFEEKPSW